MEKLNVLCKPLTAIIICLLLLTDVNAQIFRLFVKKATDSTALPAATITIPSLKKSVVADSTGLAIIRESAGGNYAITVSHVGFQPMDTVINLALTTAGTLTIFLNLLICLFTWAVVR